MYMISVMEKCVIVKRGNTYSQKSVGEMEK